MKVLQENYYITYDLGIFREHVQKTETQKYLNTVILYVPENAELRRAISIFRTEILTQNS